MDAKAKMQLDAKAKITMYLNAQGEVTSVDIDGQRLTNSTYNLYDNLPDGALKAIIPMGKMYIYERRDGTQCICFPTPNGGMV